MNEINNNETNERITNLNNNPNPDYDERPTKSGLMLAILALVVLGGIVYAISNNDDEVIVVDNADDVLIDDEITVTTTDSVIARLESSNNPNLVLGSEVNDEAVFVTEVVSDRLFRVSASDARGSGILMYLDDSLDLGSAETAIEVEVGDIVVVSGEYTNDLSDQTLEADDSNTVNVAGAVLLVMEIDFQN